MKFNHFILTIFVLAAFASCETKQKDESKLGLTDYNFLVGNDLGRNGFFDQKTIAASMGQFAYHHDIDFVAAAGDIHHFNGVASVTDPLWMTNYELIYDHPNLMLDWYAILGNHEYRGNTQACLDYSKVSRRWIMPSRYYTIVKKVDDSTTLRLVFIDTAPLIQKYRKKTDVYPDAVKQDDMAQLHFIDSVLTSSTETWKVVIGHHPIYAYTTKDSSERADMQARVDPILRKNKVDFYFNGHIHNFQHVKVKGSPVEYITNSSGSLSRPVEKMEGTQFCSPKSGFAVCSVDAKNFTLNFMDKYGESIYTFTKSK
ncbi:MAG: acid phosphatase [Porphyromonadaceae bacterium CG2_30_38_12]|nr:MAG: acid phosphatase [Porphyromonadaceae bacterium CG2_30_38_12]